MSLLNALLETYDYALKNGLVDNYKSVNDSSNQAGGKSSTVLLPIYHSSKRATTDEEIFEITLDKDSHAISGKFLLKDSVVNFPITEDSITRSGAKIAPHAISDELSYLSRGISPEKNQQYIQGVKDILEYELAHTCENIRIIGNYIVKNKIAEDFVNFVVKGATYSIEKPSKLKYEEAAEDGKTKEKTIDFEKIFITFKVDKDMSGAQPFSSDKIAHDFYISYIRQKNAQMPKSYCNIKGEEEYCIERHRGIMGNAKLISISNNDETYYGRIKTGSDVYHISYEASQKIHNMLKYLIDNKDHARFIGEGAYIINWLAHDLQKGGIELVSSINTDEDEDDDFEADDEATMGDMGGLLSARLGRYFSGEGNPLESKSDFYILIVEKISNGRVSVKYFRQMSRSEAYDRVMKWYETTGIYTKAGNKSPNLYQIVNFVYGDENSKGFLSCENKKLSRSTIERLLPCIIESKKLPKDIARTGVQRLINKRSYKKSWGTALFIGVSLIKKYKNDYKNYLIDENNLGEVEQMKESRSFYYGRLMALYEKIELDAMWNRKSADLGKADEEKTDNKGSDNKQRITNMDRLWSSFIRRPERTRHILESEKLRPYINILKRNNRGYYIKAFENPILEITNKITELEESGASSAGTLNEDYILGYYYQKGKKNA